MSETDRSEEEMKKPSSTKPEKPEWTEGYVNKHHLIYLLSIAAGIIVALLSLLFADSVYAGSMLSFAATLSSILLAVIAIIITLIDVAGQRNNILDVKTSVEDLKNVRTEIVALIDELEMKNKESSEMVVTTLELFRESHKEDIERVISKIREFKIDTSDPKGEEKVKDAQQDLENVLRSYETKIIKMAPERKRELLNNALNSLNHGEYIMNFKPKKDDK